jgi:hypothetical protein
LENLTGREHLEDLDVEGKIFWFRIGTSGEHGNELSGFVKGLELLEYLSDCHLI